MQLKAMLQNVFRAGHAMEAAQAQGEPWLGALQLLRDPSGLLSSSREENKHLQKSLLPQMALRRITMLKC